MAAILIAKKMKSDGHHGDGHHAHGKISIHQQKSNRKEGIRKSLQDKNKPKVR